MLQDRNLLQQRKPAYKRELNILHSDSAQMYTQSIAVMNSIWYNHGCKGDFLLKHLK